MIVPMQRAFSFGIPAACSFIALVVSTSALARPASVFMLQFGSFESSQEAEQRVSSLKAKHGGLIGGFPSRVMEVSVGDSLTVYRTQAGPVASRAEAQSICAQLASNGDECYVVETAMTQNPMPKQVAKAADVPASISFAKPEIPAPTVETLSAPSPASATTNMTAESVAAIAEPKVANVVLSQPTREEARAALVNDMSAVKALETAPEISKATTTPVVEPKKEDVAVATAEEPGFWSRLNPFSDDEPEVKEAVKAPAPVETAVAKVETQPVAAPAAPVETSERPRVMLPAAAGDATETASVAAMLPPPPPMNTSAKEIYERNRQEAPQLVAQAVPVATTATPVAVPVDAPAAPVPFAPASDETLTRLGKPAPAATTVGEGSVKVGEAQRVPLSGATQSQPMPMYVPSGSAIAPADASIPIRTTPRQITAPEGVPASPEALLPASQNTQKTLWAELRPYKDAASALQFWDTFRSKNPDFPVVRVRVIQSYAQTVRHDSDVALRVGPFAKRESIVYLCGQFKEVYSLKCGEITDMGISSAQGNSRTRALQGEANLATQAMMAQNAPKMQGTWWLQLGAYPSLAQAQNSWSDLKKNYAGAMVGMNPNIVVPQLSSGARPVYRLRGGPFTSEVTATRACLALKSAGGNCLVSGNTQ